MEIRNEPVSRASGRKANLANQTKTTPSLKPNYEGASILRQNKKEHKQTLRLTSLLQVRSSKKKYLDIRHGEKLPLAKDENNSCDRHTLGILHEPDTLLASFTSQTHSWHPSRARHTLGILHEPDTLLASFMSQAHSWHPS